MTGHAFGELLSPAVTKDGVDQAWPGTGVLSFSRLSERLSYVPWSGGFLGLSLGIRALRV